MTESDIKGVIIISGYVQEKNAFFAWQTYKKGYNNFRLCPGNGKDTEENKREKEIKEPGIDKGRDFTLRWESRMSKREKSGFCNGLLNSVQEIGCDT